MKIILRKLLRVSVIYPLFIAIPALCLSNFAHSITVRGTATISVKGSILSSVTDAERDAVRKAALLDAWKQYLADPDVAAVSRTLQKYSKDIESNLDQFMTRIEFLGEKLDKDKKQYTVVLSAQILDAKVTTFVNERTNAGQQASMSGSGFAVLFLMRNAVSNKQYDVTREDESDKSVSAQTTGDDDGNVSSSTKKKVSASGSTTQKADKEKFEVVEGADQAQSALGRVMSPAGFEVTNFKDIADACEQSSLYEEAIEGFARKGTVPNFNELAKLTRNCGKKIDQPFKFLAVVQAEVGAPRKDSGRQEVVASIRMNVQNIEKIIPVSIAITEFQTTGDGKSTSEARGDVMKRVGSQVGKEIVDMLNKKNLK
jgi:hypothetical protein